MTATRHSGRILLVLTSLTLAACGATATPSGVPSVSLSPAPSSAAVARLAPSVLPAASPSATPAPVVPSPSVEPSAEPSEQPTAEPKIDPGTAGPGCGTGQLGFTAHRTELPQDLHFGGATIEFTTAGIGLRNGTFQADDAIPGGLGLTPDELAVRVDPGTHIILRGAGMTITTLSAGAVPWSTVNFAEGLGSSGATPTALAARLRSDGSVSVSAPTAAGDFMVAFGLGWQTDCLNGDGVAYGRIKVN